MADEVKPAPRKPAEPGTIAFDYIKSQLFRVVHADGVLGGAGPRNNIQINFFSERLPIPQREVFGITERQTLGEEIIEQRVARAAIVREVEVGVVMEISVAKRLVNWLNEAVRNAEAIRPQRRDGTGETKNAG